MGGLTGLVGREQERRELSELLRDPAAVAVVIEGAAGVGKSSLFTALVAAAAANGRQVFVARPTEAESGLPYAGLADLLEPSVTTAAPLSAPLRAALDGALLRGDGHGPVERHAVCRATTGVLSAAAESGPVLLAVDDPRWLDAPSAAALAFAARRLDPERVTLLVTSRNGADRTGADRTDADSADEGMDQLGLDDDAVVRYRLGPLDRHSLGQLVHERTGLTLSTPRLVELHELVAGNPLHALEIVKSAGRDGIMSREPLAVPGDLAAVIERRLDELEGNARRAALAVAVAGTLPAAVARCFGAPEGLDEAVRAGIVTVDADETVRCVHPMFASVLTARVTPWEQRAVHRTLADELDDETRWVHVALGTEEPDDVVAAALELAAERYRERAALESAAKLAEAAGRLTTADGADRRRRLAAAAQYFLLAGDAGRAEELFERLIAQLDPGIERAGLLVRLADTIGDDLARSIDLAEQALVDAALAGGDAALESDCHGLLEVLQWLAGNGDASARHCRLALERAEAANDEGMIALALTELCHLQVLRAGSYDESMMSRAVSLESAVTASVPRRPSFTRGLLASFVDRLDEARPIFAHCLEQAIAEGDEAAVAAVVFRQSELELRAGRWADALKLARRFLAAAREATTDHELSIARSHLALVAAHVGLVDEADAEGHGGLTMATASGDRMVEVRARGALGLLAVSRGAAWEARSWLQPAQDVLDEVGLAELSIHHVTANLLDALVLDGAFPEAHALAGRVADIGRDAGRAWHTTIAERTLARVAAAEGSLEDALLHVDEALRAAEACPQPFERARTLLAAGEVQRRARRRGDARATFGAALELFDSLGAPLWAERAAGELGRVAGRSRSRRGDELTPTEHRIAELVASGRSNREIAAEVFVSVRTVESNLTKIYAKLGLRGRAELVAHMHQR